MTRAADVGAIDILGQRQAQTMDALQFGAQGAEREIGRKINREMMERGAAQAAIEGGLQNAFGGLGQIGSAAIYSELGKKSGSEGFEKQEMTEVAPREMASLLPEDPGAGKIGLSGAPVALPDLGIKKPGPGEIMRTLPPFQLTELDEELMGRSKVSFMREGGMVTGGKFDHKTNPIDIIQQGRKVGEMTGGEVILNPQQQKKLSKESAYFRQLLKKFNKQK
jgi:hypothetical protein